MTAITEDLTQAFIDAARADVLYTNASAAYYELNPMSQGAQPFQDTIEGLAASREMEKTKARCVSLLDVVFLKEDKPIKAKKPKKVKVETGVYVLTYDHDWGSRGTRRKTQFYFRDKPTQEDIKSCLEKNGCDPKHEEAWDLDRMVCRKAYGFKR
jgi:hypothetical protein